MSRHRPLMNAWQSYRNVQCNCKVRTHCVSGSHALTPYLRTQLIDYPQGNNRLYLVSFVTSKGKGRQCVFQGRPCCFIMTGNDGLWSWPRPDLFAAKMATTSAYHCIMASDSMSNFPAWLSCLSYRAGQITSVRQQTRDSSKADSGCWQLSITAALSMKLDHAENTNNLIITCHIFYNSMPMLLLGLRQTINPSSHTLLLHCVDINWWCSNFYLLCGALWLMYKNDSYRWKRSKIGKDLTSSVLPLFYVFLVLA